MFFFHHKLFSRHVNTAVDVAPNLWDDDIGHTSADVDMAEVDITEPGEPESSDDESQESESSQSSSELSESSPVSKKLHALQTYFPKRDLYTLIPDCHEEKKLGFKICVGDAAPEKWDEVFLPLWRVAEFYRLFLKVKATETVDDMK